MDHGFDDIAWQLLIDRIDADKCTPFLGAGMSAGAIPLGAEIAREWAEKYGYPLADNSNLSSVAQFLAVQYDPGFPAERLAEKIIGHAKETGIFRSSNLNLIAYSLNCHCLSM